MPKRKIVVVPTETELTGLELDRIWRQIGDLGRALFGCQWKTRVGKLIAPDDEGWTRARRMLDPAGEGADGRWMLWMFKVYEDEVTRRERIVRAAAAEMAQAISDGLAILTRDPNHKPPVPVPFLPWDRPVMPPSAEQVVDELHARAAARYAKADDDEEAA